MLAKLKKVEKRAVYHPKSSDITFQSSTLSTALNRVTVEITSCDCLQTILVSSDLGKNGERGKEGGLKVPCPDPLADDFAIGEEFYWSLCKLEMDHGDLIGNLHERCHSAITFVQGRFIRM